MEKGRWEACFEQKTNTMKKIIITYGLISGFIVGLIMISTMPLYDQGILDFDNGMFIGYASMVIALTMVFFGIKNYRDNHLNGSITFWAAFKVGILITSICCLLYAVTWEVYYNLWANDFTEKYSAHYLERLAKDGATAQEMAAAKTKMEEFSVMYRNPLIRFGMTITEILPVGLLVTLISAVLLRKREVFPASPVS
jgi:hypothetical protein